MQVYKLFFKILKKHLGLFFMYIGIFVSLIITMLKANGTNDVAEYQARKMTFAYFDEDNSKLSKALHSYLKNGNKERTYDNYELETVQDELYYRNVDAFIVVKEGFEKAYMNGDNAEDYMVIYDIPQDLGSNLINSVLSGYLSNGYSYRSKGVEEVISKANELSEIKAKVVVYHETNENTSDLNSFFRYLPWLFIVMSVCALSGIINKLDDEEVRKRINCSSYKFGRTNFELLLAVVSVGAFLYGVFVILSLMLVKPDYSSREGLLLLFNMAILMVLALSLTFLISRCTKKDPIISMLGNIISLGMAFLCGVFVPLEFLGSSVIRIARFLPTYWYIKALDIIEHPNMHTNAELVKCFSIQCLFIVVFMSLGIIINMVKSNRINKA